MNTKQVSFCILPVLIIASLLASIGIVLSTATTSPSVAVYPSEGPPGVLVEVFGCGFSANTSITVYIDAKLVGSDYTDSTGCFWTIIQVPEVDFGQKTVMAKDTTNRIAYTSFTVTKPILNIQPSMGPSGTEVQVSGVGLGPYQVYMLKFNNIVLETPLFINENGELPEITTRIPDAVFAGIYNFTLVYIGYYREFKYTRQIYYTSSPTVVVYREFNVTKGAATTDDIISLIKSLSELREDLESLKVNITRLKENITSLLSDLEILELNVNSNISLINSTIQELLYQLAELTTRLEELVNMTSTELNNTREELSKLLGERVQELESKITMINQSISSINNTALKLSSDLREQSSKIKSLEQTTETVRTMTIVVIAFSIIAIVLGAYSYVTLKKIRPEYAPAPA